jgi:HD-like signal output (HDOD) protein
LGKDAFFKSLDNIRDLPTLPQVAVQLNKILNDPDTTVDEVGCLIEKDQAIVGKMLRLVNSSFYGFGNSVTTVSRAVVILGFNMIRNALISVSIIDTMKGFGGSGIDLKAFWKHSISCAVIGRHLSIRSGVGSPEEAFTVGIIHDIGKLVLAKYFTEEFSKIMTEVAEGRPFFEVEAGVVPVHHNEIGAYLARRWSLPQVICDGIRFSHGADTPDASPVAALVLCANMLVNTDGAADADQGPGETFNGEMMDRLRSEIEDGGEWLPEAVSEIEAACSILLDGGKHDG